MYYMHVCVPHVSLYGQKLTFILGMKMKVSLTVIINGLDSRSQIIPKEKKKVIFSWASWPRPIISVAQEVGKNHRLGLAWL